MFAQNLRYLRKKNHMNQTELAHYLGRKSVASVSEWEAGKYTPKLPILEKIAALFKVQANDLLQYDLSRLNKSRDTLSMYTQLVPERQQHVYEVIAQELQHQRDAAKVVELPLEILNIAGVASAGTGEELVDERDQINYRGQLPKFDFAIKINGDSMEPRFHDQQVALVKKAFEAENGQIVIAYVDGRSYIKQFEHTEQTCRLISLNRKYAPIEVQDNPSFQIKGIVIGTLSN